jgi:RNA polymerase sigma factor (sigma-70 family)
VNSQTDQQLLHDYAGHGSETAFAELVRRHIDFVYSAALRMVRNTHLAEDVTQGVFVALAQNARKLAEHPVLSGWLHRTAQNLAANAVRSDVRRRVREQEAVVMNELLSDPPDAAWEQIAPQLDAALGALSEADRDALLLRYFERQSAQQMALTLGISDEAAQKRVNRAVERLRDYFSQRNVTIGASGVVVLLAANAVQAAPVGLAAAITAAAVLAGTALHTSTAIAATKTIAMTILQKTLITATLGVVAAAGFYEARQNSRLHDQVQTLQQQQAPWAEQMAQLQAENKRLSNVVADAKDQKALSQAQFDELLKLRGQTGQARTAMQDLAKLQKSSALQNNTIPAYLTNAMAQGIAMSEKFQKQAALAKLERMKAQLHLTDDQAQAVSDIMMKKIESGSQSVMDVMQGKQQMPARDPAASLNEEAAFKALLTPDQLAAYPDFTQGELIASAKSSARSDLMVMTGEMDLSTEQQDKAQAALYQLNLNKVSAPQNLDALAQAGASGNYADVMNVQIEMQKQTLENKLQALDGILTPEQLKTYEQKQLDMIDIQTSAMKMFLPQKTNAAAQ